MKYDPNLIVPVEVIQAVQTIRDFAAKHTIGNDWQIGGLMQVEASIGYYKAKMQAAESQLAHAKHALVNTAACLHARNLALDGARAQLTEVTRERDTLKAMVDLHDAMNDRRRAQANETPFKRRTYENG